MAIDDIVGRIATDARDEAQALIDAAQKQAERLRADARSRADARTAREAARGSAEAERDAATLLANARLVSRDALLTQRHELDAEALDRIVATLVALDDDRYAALLAAGIAEATTGCTALRFGSADAARLRHALPKALAAASVSIPVEDAPADVERGVVLTGDRVRVEISAAAMVQARRDDLLAEVDAALFGRGE